MNRQPLTDELPYRFRSPRLNPVCLWMARAVARSMLRDDHKIASIEMTGLDQVRPLLDQGDALLFAPNHTDHADSHLMFELSRRLGRPFYYMAAYQIFLGKRGWFLPRVGAFPVDREGADLTAFKTGVELLARARNPLVIFPEGEMYHLGDRLTPLREGAVAVATTALKRLSDRSGNVWIVPVAIKYRFIESCDPLPALHDLMDALERRANWWVRRDLPLVERIYRFALGMLCLKEYEYLGTPQSGGIPDRLTHLRESILTPIESRRLAGDRRAPNVPERIKSLRRACLDALAAPDLDADAVLALKKDLHDVFVVAQIFSYPGDYVRAAPTLERAAETLMKFEEDFLGVFEVTPRAPRRALVRLGRPIDVRERLGSSGKARTAIPAITIELEAALQGLLDEFGPGRMIAGDASGSSRSESR